MRFSEGTQYPALIAFLVQTSKTSISLTMCKRRVVIDVQYVCIISFPVLLNWLESMRLTIDRDLGESINWSANSFEINHVTSMS